MPNFNAEISGFAVGDYITVRRTINRTSSNLPTGETITQAWFTVKENITDADGSAIVQKVITTVDDPGNNGHIEEDGGSGAGTADPVLRFDFLSADTEAIDTNHRWYDIQVKTSTNAIYTGEKGEIWGEDDVTTSVS